MKRDLQRLAQEQFDLLIIGGGITGATIAWDAALRGLSVALVERKDFGSATSAATSKLVHGGLRYLKNLEVGLVRESLRERRIMEFVAPHLVHPLPFVIPTYGRVFTRMVQMGMCLYDGLGFDKALMADPDKRIPGHQYLSKAEVLEIFPQLPAQGLSGGFLYYDCQMISPDRLTLAFLQSAERVGAVVANWAEVTGFVMNHRAIRATQVREETTAQVFPVQARCVVNATGCWLDQILHLLPGAKATSHVLRSKGIHLIIPSHHPTHALAMQTASKRHLFLLPWRGLTIAGPTDTPYQDDPDSLMISPDDIAGLLAELNQVYPNLGLRATDCLVSYGGLRPLGAAPGVHDSYKASRKHIILDHASEGGPTNLLSVIGAKYTTARNLARLVVNCVYPKLQKSPSLCRTATTRLFFAPDAPFAQYQADACRDNPDLPRSLVEHLATHYGTNWQAIATRLRQNSLWREPLGSQAKDIGAQVYYAAESELALHLEDALWRRTNIALVGRLEKSTLEKCARIMGDCLHWSPQQIVEEVAQAQRRWQQSQVG